MVETTIAFADTFQRDDENPLSTNGWTSTTLRLLSGAVISTSQDLWGRAVQTTSIPRSADQEIGAEVGCGRDSQFGMLGITSLASGAPGVLTTASAHGVTVAESVQLVMFGVTATAGTLSPNGIVYTAVSSGASTFTIAAITAGTFTTAGAVVMPWENFIAVAGRITGGTTPPTTFQNGYLLALNYEAAAVRRLLVLRYFNDGVTADRLALLAQGTVTLQALNGSDLSIGQEIRLTITQDGEAVRLRGYVNNNNDESPNLEVIDRGRSFYLSDSAPHFPPPSAPGYFAILVGDDNALTPTGLRNGAVLMGFYARDNAAVETENPYAGRTLAQLRTSVERKVNRSTQTNAQGLVTNQFLNEAQEEFLAALGDLALFSRRTEVMTLTEDAFGRIYLPRHVDRLDRIWDTTGYPLHWWLRDYADDGMLVISMTNGPGLTGTDYMVSYYKRYAPLLQDTDRTIVPRRLDEALVIGAAMRWAENDSDGSFYRAMAARWQQAIQLAKTHMGRQMRMTKVRMTTSLGFRSAWSRYVPDSRDLGFLW